MSETWRQIDGYSSYEVSDLGRVRSVDRVDGVGRARSTRVLTLQRNPAGRVIVGLYANGRKKSHQVSVLVAHAFLGPKIDPSARVCHDNGDVADNRAVNLRFDSQRANCADKRRHGTAQAGRVGNARLTDAKVREIRDRRSRGESYTTIAVALGVSPSAVGNVVRGELWRHVR